MSEPTKPNALASLNPLRQSGIRRWIIVGIAALVAIAVTAVIVLAATTQRYEGYGVDQLKSLSRVLSGGSTTFDDTAGRRDPNPEVATTLTAPCQLASHVFGPWMGFSNAEQWKSNEFSGHFTIPMPGADENFVSLDGAATEDTKQETDVTVHLFSNPAQAKRYVSALVVQLGECQDVASGFGTANFSKVETLDAGLTVEAYRWTRYLERDDTGETEAMLMSIGVRDNLVLISSYQSVGSDINDKVSADAVNQMFEELSSY